jgi:putative two-component system response regulator
MSHLQIHQPLLYQHSLEVGDLCDRLSHLLPFSPVDRRLTLRAALLHDIGKIHLSRAILEKTTSLDDSEYRYVQQHVLRGEQLLRSMDLDEEADIVATHHERWDGTGYPHGLTGRKVPLAGRLVHLADCIAAMLQRRSYKAAYPLHHVLDEISRSAGSHFDPQLVRTALICLQRKTTVQKARAA